MGTDTSRISVRSDPIFLPLLGAMAFVPLVVLRGNPILQSSWFLPTLFSLTAVLWVSWIWLTRHRQPFASDPPHGDNKPWRTGFALLLVVNTLAFAWPLSKHFWGGIDEQASYMPENCAPWCPKVDASQGRPMVMLSPWLVHQTGGRIEAFLAMGVLLLLANSCLLWSLLRRLLLGAEQVTLAAAVLFVCHGGEPLRFYVIWASNLYWTGLFFLLLAFRLLLLSSDRQSRILLTAACVSLGVSLLIYEAGFPLALLGSVALWQVRRPGNANCTWQLVWLGTVGLLAVRTAIAMFLSDGESYQLRTASHHSPGQDAYLSRCRELVAPMGTYWAAERFPIAYLGLALLPMGAAVFCLWRAREECDDRPRRYALAASVAVIATVLGLLPFFPLHGTTMRTQYYAAPAEATLLALGLGLLSCLSLRRIRAGVVPVGTALLVGLSFCNAHQLQDSRDRQVYFEKTTHVFQQLQAIAPSLTEGSVILLLVENPADNPLGLNGSSSQIVRKDLLGVPLWMVNVEDPYENLFLLEDRVEFRGPGGKSAIPYDRVIAFQARADGTLLFLPTLPVQSEAAERYHPLARMRPGAIAFSPHFRCPFWIVPPTDVLDPSDGVLFGPGWSDIEAGGGEYWRNVESGAELLINPQGETSRPLTFEVSPEVPGDWRLSVEDLAGRAVASATGTGRRSVELRVPVDRDQLNRVRLRLATDVGPVPMFRVYCRPGGVPLAYRWMRQDVAGDGIRIGRGWYPLERFKDQRFRWLNTDGVLQLADGSGRLALDVEPGPGMRGQPCEMQLLDETGNVLGHATATGRQVVTFPLPDRRRFAVTLRVPGGGGPTAKDPRILNVRLFGCWRQ